MQNLLEFPAAKAETFLTYVADYGQLQEFLINDDVEMLMDLVDILETMEVGFVNVSDFL